MAGDDELVEIRIRLKDARRFQTDARGVSRHVDDIGDKAERTGRRMRAASMAARGFGFGIRSMATAAKYGAVSLAVFGVGAATFSVNAASNLTEQMNKSAVVFRGHEKGVQRWAGTLADSFGVSKREGLEAAGVFGNMLVPMGFARGAAAKMSKGLVQLSGDMASFNNADPSEVLEAMRSGLSGEAEPLRKYGIFLNDAVIQQEAMRLGLKKVGGELTSAQKAQAIYGVVMQQTKDAQGDFGRSAGTSLANQLRILRATTENLASTLGEKLLPFVLDVVKGVVGMSDTFDRARKSGASFGFAIATALDGAVGGGKRFRDAFIKVKDVGNRAWDMLKNLWSGATDLVVAMDPFPGTGGKSADVLGRLASAAETATEWFAAFGSWMRAGGLLADITKIAIWGVVGAVVAYKLAVIAMGRAKVAWSAVETAYIGLLIAQGYAATGAAAASRGLTVAMLSLNLALAANPIGLVVLAVVALVAIMATAFIKYKKITDANWKLKLALYMLMGPIGAVILGVAYLRKAWDKWGDAGIEKVKAFGRGVADVWGKVKSGFGSVIDWLKNKWNDFAGALNEGLEVAGSIPGVPDNMALPTFSTGGGGSSAPVSSPPPTNPFNPFQPARIDPVPSRLANRMRSMIPAEPFAGMAPAPAGGAGGDGGAWEVHVYIDGEKVNTKLARVVKRKAARK